VNKAVCMHYEGNYEYKVNNSDVEEGTVMEANA
jgi:hypothetical protein